MDVLTPLIALPAAGMPTWLRILIGAVVVVAMLVGIAGMIRAMRRNAELQDGAPPLPGPPSPVAPDDEPLEQRLAAIDDAYASGRIDASERERARRALLGDDPDAVR